MSRTAIKPHPGGGTSEREQWIQRRACELLRGSDCAVWSDEYRAAFRQARREWQEMRQKEDAA